MRTRTVRTLAMVVGLLVADSVRAVDIEGVLPASLDQPRIYLAIAKDATSAPLSAKAADGGLDALLGGGDKKKGEEARTFGVEAFLDTGASGVMLSKPTADGLGLVAPPAGAGGAPVKFSDAGIGGEEPFDVTAPMFLRTCTYSGTSDGEGIERYAPLANAQPVRVNIRESSGLMDELTGGMDIAGMPTMQGKVMVVDCKPLKAMDKLATSLVAPGDKSIPQPDVVVPLSYVDFARFTHTEPAGRPVSLAPSPMIGPDPFNPNDRATPVQLTHGGKRAAITMLLDTGATSSFISIATAKQLGIDVDDEGTLKNVPEKQQFTLPIGGIGGSKNVHGFYVDSITLPTSKGEAVRYVHAPVMVMDVSITDPATKQTFTLAGVFGMNYLVSSANISMNLNNIMDGGIGDMHDGAFDSFAIDHVNKTLGLKLAK